jgi:hypothetical protein
LNDLDRCDRTGSSICLDEIEFSFLNGNLVVPTKPSAYFRPAARRCAPQKVQVNTN